MRRMHGLSGGCLLQPMPLEPSIFAGRLDEAQRYFEYTLDVEGDNIEALVRPISTDFTQRPNPKGLA